MFFYFLNGKVKILFTIIEDHYYAVEICRGWLLPNSKPTSCTLALIDWKLFFLGSSPITDSPNQPVTKLQKYVTEVHNWQKVKTFHQGKFDKYDSADTKRQKQL